MEKLSMVKRWCEWEHRTSNEEKLSAFMFWATVDLPLRYGLAYMEVEGFFGGGNAIAKIKPKFKIPKPKKPGFFSKFKIKKKNPYKDWVDPGEGKRPLKRVVEEWAFARQPGTEIDFVVKEGRILNKSGEPVSGEFDYIFDINGKLKIGDGHYFLTGNTSIMPNQLAGDIRIKNGYIEEIGVGSGHFQWSDKFGEIALPQYLKKSGVDTSTFKFRSLEESQEVARKLSNGEEKVARENVIYKE